VSSRRAASTNPRAITRGGENVGSIKKKRRKKMTKHKYRKRMKADRHKKK